MDPQEIENLFERYNNGEATPEERALVETWYLTYGGKKTDPLPGQVKTDQQESLNELLSQINPERRLWPRFAAAASILLFISIGGWLFISHKKSQDNQYAANQVARKQILPGGNKAIITLSDGTNITLGDAKIGLLATQGNTQIDQTQHGQIRYAATEASDTKSSNALMYNTASTPRGGQYQLVLSDGTKVWLNASSSIRFPVVFKGSERRVQITGEAYFEVAHNAAMPFRVEARGQTVEVLGTHFNVNAYDDEASVKTTLLEGSVKVTAEGGSATIKPGEQADLKDGKLSVDEVDVGDVVAWKNGYFSFKDDDLKGVMRQISRWYDVDITYDGNIPERKFSGEIARNTNISQMLDILTFKKIHYKITGNQIIIKP
jgi:ferric-dicitrate binding protein FerR (iron transport regulator)